MKSILNLGCGLDIHSDAHNVDFRAACVGVDEICDLSVFPWPWGAGSFSEIRMFDFLEHFPISRTDAIISECHRLLLSEGKLVVQVPDMKILGRVLSGLGGFPCHSCGSEFTLGVGATSDEDKCVGNCGMFLSDSVRAAIGRIYGGQDYPGNFHMAGFTKMSMVKKLASCGFVEPEFLEIDHQYKNWNFKVKVKKGSALWK